MSRRSAFCAVIGGLLVAASAGAHTRSVSYSSWNLDDTGATVRVRIPLLELSRLSLDPTLDVGSGGRAAIYLAERLSLFVGDERCTSSEAPVAEAAPRGWAHFRWRARCTTSGTPSIESALFREVAPSHMHFARTDVPGGGVQERVLNRADPRWILVSAEAASGSASSGTTLVGYIGLGIEHILSGWDHLAFVVALLLLARRLSEVAGLVTSFTVAHSVTLGLATLGVMRPDGAVVEALIGYSIALVAAENGWLLAGRGRSIPGIAAGGTIVLAALAVGGVGRVPPLTYVGLALFAACHFALLDRVERPARLRVAVAFAFGLVHGFGFAGVLAELELPTERLAAALFGFNVGVELGQLAIVVAVWPALYALARHSPARGYPAIAQAGSAAICGLGLFWFLSRAW